MKGNKGELYHQHGPKIAAKQTFNNHKAVGLLLDMDNYTLDYFIEGKHVLKYEFPGWKGQTIYPAASLIVGPEEMQIRFDVKPPKIERGKNVQ